MKEHAIYFGKPCFYQLIRDLGGTWNDSKDRPIVCLVKSSEIIGLYWAIPIGNYEHRTQDGKDRIARYLNKNDKNIQSCFYHIGNTNKKSIFFLSDVVPITNYYIDKEYLGKSKNIYVIKNKILLKELNYKLSRILSYENSNPNFFRQHITDIKNYLINELNSSALLEVAATQEADNALNNNE